ncbi:putative set domain-containing protein [Diaporthe ampelina]|uniref:Ribosomal lysine N-methyltransferase 4 n=1 Tax=Diaporthe ampelina TaxID=1214573 RepID=A0A0G2HBV7_9PEZI|nr:putative set domain-containing protein [Diaporthe ampelina]
MTQQTFHQKTSEFSTWFRAQPGTTFHDDIEVRDLRDRGAGRGIVAKADISPGTVLFTIPRQTIICINNSSLATRIPGLFSPPEEEEGADHDMNDEAEDGEDDGDNDTSQDSWTSLILVLIYEYLQDASSPWKPYLDVLPTVTDFSTPMFWAADELAELQASPVAGKVGREEAEKMVRTKILPVVRDHRAVFFPEGSGELSDDELVQLAIRMGSVIMAYAFDLEKEDDDDDEQRDEDAGEEDEWVEDREGKTMLGMVPMADILNADASFNAHIEHGEHALTATSLRPIGAGEEILNYYGPLSNGELLRRYGYVTRAHRRWNLVDLAWPPVLAALRAEVPLPASQWDEALGALEEDELEEDAFVIERGADDPDSEGRVGEVDKAAGAPEDLVEQLKAVMKAVKKVRPEAVPDKAARDRVIYSAISRALDERARQYGTTLEQDLKRYEEGGDGADQKVRRQRMALDVRIGEKVLLRQAAESVKAKLAELAKAESDGEKPSAKRRRV